MLQTVPCSLGKPDAAAGWRCHPCMVHGRAQHCCRSEKHLTGWQVRHVAPLQPPSLAAPPPGLTMPSVPLGHMVSPSLLGSTAAAPPALPSAGLAGPLMPTPADLPPPLLFQVRRLPC